MKHLIFFTATILLVFSVASLHAESDYDRCNYGETIVAGQNTVWWCEATQKIHPRRPAPEATTGNPSKNGAKFSAARNDFEAVQIVVRSEKGLKNLTATIGSLKGPDGAVIATADIQILRVYYHFVENPTDKTGTRDRWPDALPPLDEPIDVATGENQPLWVLVHIRQDAKPGEYYGQLKLKADGWEASVPVHLHVWNFVLPEKNHIKTSFGFTAKNVFDYHQLTTEADKRRVLAMYMQSFADHRISPDNPVPMDPIRVHFHTKSDTPSVDIDFTNFDKAMSEAMKKYNFTGLRLRIHGIGAGSFNCRHEPKIGPFGENTPQYQSLLSSYLKRLESHLREKDWLDLAYVYWFDEPKPKDYAFVKKGMERLRKHAPSLLRLLTLQPEQDLTGQVDIWCPVMHRYDEKSHEVCAKRGERMWWYVCCVPKAPYCTLFIDHPATELRVWLWQTWKRNITGILVWRVNYWTSETAFPDSEQNPYEDPMSYRRGSWMSRGEKQFWGNGDGRLIYPPLAAAVPGQSGDQPVIAPPVSSIRWEMLREGIEDYEFLYMLRELYQRHRQYLSESERSRIESLLTVPVEISTGLKNFTTEPSPIYARRAAIAAEIERLTKLNNYE